MPVWFGLPVILTANFLLKEQPSFDTARLRVRELRDADAEAMLVMESNPRVHRYLDSEPILDIDEIRRIIGLVREQYASIGIGRWGVEELATGEFVGWTGFKWIDEPINGHSDFLDVGYRFLESSWGQGFATESALACMQFAASHPALMQLPIAGIVDAENIASERVLQKLGLTHTDSFDYLGIAVRFYELKR